MPIPNAQDLRKPILTIFKGEAPHNFSINEFLEQMAEYFGVNLNDLSSVEKSSFKNAINEAKSYLIVNKLLSNPSGNVYMITNAGTKFIGVTNDDEELTEEVDAVVVAEEPTEQIDTVVDEEPTEDVDAIVDEEPTEDVDAVVDDEESTEEVDTVVDEEPTEDVDAIVDEEPIEEADTVVEAEETTEQADTVVDEEQTEEVDTIEEENTVTENLDTEEDYIMTEQQDDIESVIVRHNSELADELLAKITALSPESFEMLVIDLLSKMGYFAFRSARYTTDDSDLIHGVILDNKTGANIYIQARKLSPDKTVGRADIQDFIDELSDKGGTGIFATTAAFSENARILADDERIMLIDGEKLASLMMTHDFCVNTEKVYEVKALDSEAFQAYEQ